MIRTQTLHRPSSITQSRLLKLSLLLFLALILLFPSLAFAGARNGLLLWWDTILPTLLPFMIISGLIIRLRITHALSYLFYPVFKHLLPISREGCYPVFIGFLAGYPVGAKTTADLMLQSSLSRKEAQLLCAITNNASPMFVLGYIAGNKLLAPELGLWLLLILYFASYSGALVWYFFYCRIHKFHTASINDEESTQVLKAPHFQFSMLDDSILNAFEVVTKVGGYLVLFSVLASFITSLPLKDATLTACLTGVLEITTGIQNISNLSLPFDLKVILVTTITAFGGFSSYAQTKSVIGETSISSSTYLLTKAISALFALIYSSIFVLFLS